MVGLVFWVSYVALLLGALMWFAKHPLSVGAVVLFSYMLGSIIVGFSVSFVVGVFLFLTGVSGMMVAFLYVVALCPNPVFSGMKDEEGYVGKFLVYFFVGVGVPGMVVSKSLFLSFGLEAASLSECFQWWRDPIMVNGLAELMPFMGFLLFLCMVSVVSLCGHQKQCLGGHSLMVSKRSYD